jgi:hypothetical protein
MRDTQLEAYMALLTREIEADLKVPDNHSFIACFGGLETLDDASMDESVLSPLTPPQVVAYGWRAHERSRYVIAYAQMSPGARVYGISRDGAREVMIRDVHSDPEKFELIDLTDPAAPVDVVAEIDRLYAEYFDALVFT